MFYNDIIINPIKLKSGNRIDVDLRKFVSDVQWYRVHQLSRDEFENHWFHYNLKNTHSNLLGERNILSGDETLLFHEKTITTEGYKQTLKGRDKTDRLSSKIKSWIIDTYLDSETLSWYESEYEVDIRNWVYIDNSNKIEIKRLYDSEDFDGNNNRSFINNIRGENFFEWTKVFEFNEYVDTVSLDNSTGLIIDNYLDRFFIPRDFSEKLCVVEGYSSLTVYEMMENIIESIKGE